MRADWYDHPSWYDILHTPGTAREVTGLQRIARRYAGAGAMRWLEPACGPGRYLRVAAGRGVRVAGFDLNPAMVAYARAWFERRGLRGDVFEADMTRFRTPRGARYDFAFCPINSVRHLLSDEAMLGHLEAVRRALKPGGVYALGVETTIYGGTFPAEDVWVGSRGVVTVRQVVNYRPPRRKERVERVFSHLTIETPSRTHSLESAYDLRSYDRGEYEALLKKAGWEVLGRCNSDGREALLTPDGDVVGGYALYVLRPVGGGRR